MRDDELRLILDTTGLGYGDTALDVAAGVRAEIVRDMTEHQLPALTLQEIYARFVIYRALENLNGTIEAALFRDIERLALTKQLPNLSTSIPVAAHPSTAGDRDGQIRAALDADPSRSDRDIARSCRCSPTTVGKVRRVMGLHRLVRSVQRCGQTFEMKFAFGGNKR